MGSSQAAGLAFLVGIFLLITLLIVYFSFLKKAVEKNKLETKKFKVFLLVLWIIFSALSTYILTVMVDRVICMFVLTLVGIVF